MSRTVYQYGNAVIPPTPGATAASLIENCDPLLLALGEGFAWALRRQLGDAWAAAAAGFAGNEIVGSVHTVDPVPETARLTWAWPALALWRGETRYGLRTLMYDGHETDLHVVFALPPLTHEFLTRLAHVRVAVARTLRMFVEEKGHPEYLGGVNWLEAIGLDAMELVESEEGSAFEKADLQQKHVGLRMMFVMREREVETATLSGIEDRTFTANQIDLDDGVSAAVTIVNANTGGLLPEVALTTPAEGFALTVGESLVASGTCANAFVVEVFESVNEGAWSSIGRVSAAGGTSFAITRTMTGDDEGAVELKAIAYGPGGQTESEIVTGTVSS